MPEAATSPARALTNGREADSGRAGHRFAGRWSRLFASSQAESHYGVASSAPNSSIRSWTYSAHASSVSCIRSRASASGVAEYW